MNTTKKLEVLLIEDHLPDAHLVRRTLNKSGIDHTLRVIWDGEDALRYLEEFTPDIIFIDLNLPKVNGLEILTEVSNNKRLKDIPVAIVTTSNTDLFKEVTEVFDVETYIVKPLKVEDVYSFLYSNNLLVI